MNLQVYYCKTNNDENVTFGDISCLLQYFQRNSCTGLRICEGVMVLCQVIAAAGGYDVKRMTTFGPDLA